MPAVKSRLKPTLDCKKLAAHLSELLDEEAPAMLSNWAFRHLRECAYCQSQASEMKGLVDRCKTLEDGSPSAECRKKLVERFREMQGSARRK